MLISNRKVLESNFTRCLIELRNPMFLRGSWWTLGVILNRAWTFPHFQVLQLSKVLTEAIPLPPFPPNLPMGDFTKQGCLKTSNTFTWEVLIKYSSIIPCGDSHKEKVEAANKLLKDIYVGEIVDFAGNSNIKRHLNRIYIWDISLSVDNLLNNFNPVWLHSKFILFTGSSSLSLHNAKPSFFVSNDIPKIWKQRVDNALNV